MKYMFEMTLHEVKMHVPYDVQVIVVLKRGSRRLESQKQVTIGSGRPNGDFADEKLAMMTTVYKDRATQQFQDRVVSVTFISLIELICDSASH